MDLSGLKALFSGMDPSALLPEMEQVMGWLALALRYAVLAGPVCLLVLGLCYLLVAPKEANRILGYRFFWSMSSVAAWRFTQRLVGVVWSVLGLILTLVMRSVVGKFGTQPDTEAITAAITALLWQAGLILVSCIAVDIAVIVKFNRKGMPRKKSKGAILQ